MKKFVTAFLLPVLFISLSTIFYSCDDDDDVDTEWRDINWEAYLNVVADPDFSEVVGSDGSPEGAYKRIINSGTGDVRPFQTSTVKVNYKGYYYDEILFDAGNSVSEIPASISLNEVVRGFSVALQTMVVGDKWEIVIPYFLGYGETNKIDSYGNITMKGYTTLFFEVELLEIDLYNNAE